MKKIYIPVVYALISIVMLISLFRMSKSDFPITSRVIEIPKKNNAAIDNEVDYSFSQNIPAENNLAIRNVEYRVYWIENKVNIAVKFNSYIGKFHQIDCIDHRKLRELLYPNHEIKIIANNITANLTDELDIAYALHQFVHANIEYKEINKSLTPAQILSLRKGDCSEKSILLASLLKTVNINSYVADGYKHRYIFVEINGIWLPIDPSTKDFYFVYKNWDNKQINYYHSDIQPFIFNSKTTLFNKNWCI